MIILKLGASYKHILKYISIFGSVQGLNILIGIVRTKCVALLLGPSGVGLISIYNSATSLLQTSTNLGLQASGVREISHEGEGRIAVLRLWSLILAALGFVVTLACGYPLRQWVFNVSEYQLQFEFLAPVVAMSTITGGETAVLKATRKLKQLAQVSVIGVACSLIISVPLYYFWGFRAVLPSLNIVALTQLVITLCYSYRLSPLKLSWSQLGQGRTMLKIGLSFVVAGVFGAAADLIIKAYLSDISVCVAGLYNTAYMIVMTYAGLVFAALEADYFPHLSSVCNDKIKMNGAVNRQIEVTLAVAVPLLIILFFCMPFVVPLLFSAEFCAVIPVARVALGAMVFRAINLPLSYIMLAKGDSKPYMLLEFMYYAVLVLTVIFGYKLFGLLGTGIGLVVSGFVESVVLIAFSMWRYDLRLHLFHHRVRVVEP